MADQSAPEPASFDYLAHSQEKPERLHALDAVRAIALLLGIVLHGAMSFMPGLLDIGWPIADVSAHAALNYTFYVIHVFRMAAFFLIAGFFAHLVFHRRGLKAYIKDRSKRIALPLVAFWFPLIAAITATIVWAVSINGAQEDPAVPPGIPLVHLWFLYMLLWIYFFALVIRTVAAKLDQAGSMRRSVDRLFARIIRTPWAAMLLALPVMAVLYSTPDWIAWEGIRTQMNLELPIVQPLLIYAYFFGLGWLLDRQRQLLETFRRNWLVYLLIATVATAISLHLSGWEAELLDPIAADIKLPYAASYGLAVLTMSLAFVGLGLVLFSRESPLMRYLADASYWIYLMHMPVVMFFQVLLMKVPLNWFVKFPLICLLTFVPLIITYEWWVRSTWLGALLNGQRRARGLPPPSGGLSSQRPVS